MLNGLRSVSVAIAVVSLGLLVGCGQDEIPSDGAAPQETSPSAETPDPHDVPLTEEEIAQLEKDTAQYTDAVEHIQQFQATIQRETTQGEPAKAHRALDKLNVVLERLPAAARDSGVPKARWREVNETAQHLSELFDQVHANIDAGADPNYEAVADQIEQGAETLAGIEPEETE